MLINLRIDSPRPACARDAVDMLLECHERIRNHSTLALRLARGEGDARMRQDAAGQLVRYFGIALPLHVEDEDQSVSPRLNAAGIASPEGEALAEMTRQHEEIEARLAALLPRWKSLPESQAGLLEPSEGLAELLEAHLRLEEKVIFPAMREHLTPADNLALMSEFRARREPQRQDP